MRRRFPIWSLAALLAAAMVLGPRYARGEAGSFPGFVFHLTPYGESREQEAFYQGLVIGPRGEAVVPICAIERATHAIGLFAQGQSATIGEVQAVDEAAGLATVRLEGPKPARSRGPFSPFPPERGHRVQFLNTSRDGTWAVVQCSLRSVEVVRDLPGLAVVRTTLPLPPPGGVVLDADGRLLGSIAVRFGEGDVGVVVSADRIEALKAEPPLNQTLALWSAGREDRWSDSTFAGYLEGVYACSEGRYGEAMRLLEEHVGAAGEMEPLICSLLGEAYEGSGLLPEAILALRRAVDQGAHDCAVYRRLIQDYERTGQGDSARSTCEELRERKPGEATGHVLTAHLANLRGNYASAVDAAFRALEVEAGCPCALYELGLAYANMRSYEMALDPLMRATTRDPYDGEAFNLLGYVYLRSNRPLHAIVVLREATELTRGASAPWKSLGEAYSAAGLNARARDAYERAIEKDPGDVNLYVSLSREMAKEDGCEDAVKVLKRGLVECGPSAWLTYHLGKTYALGGQVDLARQQAQQLAGMNRNLSLQLLRVIELRDSL